MVECYKKIVCQNKTNWTFGSVLFGLLSTKGKKNLQQKYNRRLIIGLWRVKLRVIALSVLCLPTADHTHSPYRHQALQSVSENKHVETKSTDMENFGYELWNLSQSLQKLYSNIFVSAKDILQGFFFHNHLLPLLTALLLLFSFKFIFWSSLFTLKSL